MQKLFILLALWVFCALTASSLFAQDNQREESRLFQESLTAIDAGDWDQAEEILLELLRLRPRDPVIFNNLAWVYFQKNQPERGEEVLLAAISTNSIYYTVYNNISNMRKHKAAAGYIELLDNKHDKKSLPEVRIIRQSAPQELLASNNNSNDSQEALLLDPEIVELIKNNQAKRLARIREERIRQEDAHTVAEEVDRKRRQQSAQQGTVDAVRARIRNWAKAWSSGNAKKYLTFYADNFKPNKMTLAAWRKQRFQRITPSRNIKVTYKNTVVDINSEENEAITTFTQSYRANNYRSTNKKRLTWRLVDNKWLIVREKSIR